MQVANWMSMLRVLLAYVCSKTQELTVSRDVRVPLLQGSLHVHQSKRRQDGGPRARSAKHASCHEQYLCVRPTPPAEDAGKQRHRLEHPLCKQSHADLTPAQDLLDLGAIHHMRGQHADSARL